MQIYRSDQTFSVIIFLGNIDSGKLCVLKVFEYMKQDYKDRFRSRCLVSLTAASQI